jgi:hypothetical protein
VKKKVMILISLLSFFGILSFTRVAYGLPPDCDLIYFKTDKQMYFMDEEIRLNATWDLNYDNGAEISFVQIQIFEIFEYSNKSIWNSSEYHEIGVSTINLTIDIQDLNINLLGDSTNISINFYYYYYENSSGNEWALYLDSIKLKIINNLQPFCVLMNFMTSKDIYALEEELDINAVWDLRYKLFDEISDIQIQVFDNDNNLIWNSSKYQERGILNRTWNLIIQDLNITLIADSTNISIKFYYTYWDISQGNGWNLFLGELNVKIVKKAEIFIDTYNFKEILGENDNIEICFLLYYYINNTQMFLINGLIKLEVFHAGTLIYQEEYLTDNRGRFSVKISAEILTVTKKNNEFVINLIFGGTYYLKSTQFTLTTKIEVSSTLNYFPFFSISIILTSLFMIILYNNNKKTKERYLAEISIKY